jgi:photosystem II stability/assembly factor-like uncharacterized protein
MLKRSLILATALLLYNCSGPEYQFDLVEVNTPGTSSLRAIFAVDADVVWVSGSEGKVYLSLNGGQSWNQNTVPGCEETEFRSLHAWDAQRALVFDVSPSGRAYMTSDGGLNWVQVYQSPTAGAFFNSMKFSSEQQGIAISDPIDEQVFVLKTVDGGKSWKRLDNLPSSQEGEINFAASNTCIEYLSTGEIYIVTGGSKSRILCSFDDGESWEFKDTPMITGPSAGLFSVCITDSGSGAAVGGDFNDPLREGIRAIYTKDGGKNWNAAESMPAAYRSCVVSMSEEFFIAIGKTGCDYSTDGGKNWVYMDSAGYYAASAVPGNNILYVAGAEGSVAKVTVRNKK